MDEQTRKELEDAYATLMRASKIIKRMLDGDRAKVVAVSELKGQNVSIASADLARLRD